MLLLFIQSELVYVYLEQNNNCTLSCPKKVCDGVHVSLVSDLYISQCASALIAHCSSLHASPYIKCSGLLKYIELVYEQDFCILSEAFKLTSAGVKYTAEHAKTELFQITLVTIRLCDPNKGSPYHPIAKMSILMPQDAKLWMDHLYSIALNRKWGVQKAAATSCAKKAQNTQPSGTTITAHPALYSRLHDVLTLEAVGRSSKIRQ